MCIATRTSQQQRRNAPVVYLPSNVTTEFVATAEEHGPGAATDGNLSAEAERGESAQHLIPPAVFSHATNDSNDSNEQPVEIFNSSVGLHRVDDHYLHTGPHSNPSTTYSGCLRTKNFRRMAMGIYNTIVDLGLLLLILLMGCIMYDVEITIGSGDSTTDGGERQCGEAPPNPGDLWGSGRVVIRNQDRYPNASRRSGRANDLRAGSTSLGSISRADVMV